MWGKIFGSFAGFAMGGPFGALLGAAAGHAYDRIITGDEPEALPPPGGAAGHAAQQSAFSIAVVVLGAKLAKVDGAVRRTEINAFKEVFRVPAAEVPQIARVYDSAKLDSGGFEPYAQQIALMFRREPAVLEDLLASLFFIAKSDGEVNRTELGFLKKVADIFRLDGRSFERVRAMFMRGDAGDPYGVLGVDHNAPDDEVKRVYRQLIREHHPDTLMARGLPKDFIEIANQKMAAINAAYDQIGRERRRK